MMEEYVWTDQQFEVMSWHDNHVHALRVVEGAYGAGELVLDIDYILEWIAVEDGFQFRIIPASLEFKEVTNLRVALDYATPTAAIGPFSIHAIERRSKDRDRYVATIWRILINWPNGGITFEAAGFVQRGIGAPVLTRSQSLRPEERDHRA